MTSSCSASPATLLDKSNRFTDWTRRPADGRATDLRGLGRHPSARRLSETARPISDGADRTEWVAEEMDVLTSPDTYKLEPEKAWQRLRTRVRKPKELAVLIEVAAWREREAQARDIPRRPRAQGRPRRRHRGAGADDDRAALQPALAAQGLRAFEMGARHPRSRQTRASRAIRRRCPRSSATSRRRTAQRSSNLLKVLLRMTAERHAVAAKVIATVDDLEQIAADDNADVPAMKGWRRELFGEKALCAQERQGWRSRSKKAA